MRHRERMMKDLDQDILDHIAMETQDNIERGMSQKRLAQSTVVKMVLNPGKAVA